MGSIDAQKKENFSHVSYVTRPSVQARLDRRMIEAFARIEGAGGTVPSRGIYKIRAGEHHPWRVLFRRFAEASKQQTRLEDLENVLDELKAAVRDELYRSPGNSGRAA